jgi:hypothetical protein
MCTCCTLQERASKLEDRGSSCDEAAAGAAAQAAASSTGISQVVALQQSLPRWLSEHGDTAGASGVVEDRNGA